MSIQSLTSDSLKIKYYTKGELIFNEGAAARFFYEIQNGEVKIANRNDEGKEFIQGVYKQGDSFGVPPLICDKPYPAAAYAHTDCAVYVVAKEQFLALMRDNYDFHFAITKMLGNRLLFKAMMLDEVANQEGEHRLLTLIHYLMAQKDLANKTLDITKQQLADMTGLRVETVIRIMKSIEDKGMITTSRGSIVCNTHKKNQ